MLDSKQIIAILIAGAIGAATIAWSQVSTNTHDISRHERTIEKMAGDISYIREGIARLEGVNDE